jgi:hypothetical protein
MRTYWSCSDWHLLGLALATRARDVALQGEWEAVWPLDSCTWEGLCTLWREFPCVWSIRRAWTTRIVVRAFRYVGTGSTLCSIGVRSGSTTSKLFHQHICVVCGSDRSDFTRSACRFLCTVQIQIHNPHSRVTSLHTIDAPTINWKGLGVDVTHITYTIVAPSDQSSSCELLLCACRRSL